MTNLSEKEETLHQLKQERLCVLYGGWSAEREVSLRSGKAVYDSLVREGYSVTLRDISALSDLEGVVADRVVLMLHGGDGENGVVQAYLSDRNIPFTGSSEAACQIAMNKLKTKEVLHQNGVPTPLFATTIKGAAELPFPVVRKPHSEGSSVGVSILQSAEDLLSLEENADYFFETFIDGMEVTVGVLENEEGPYVLPPLELVPNAAFYDYQSKYTKGETRFIIPATLSSEMSDTVQKLAIAVHTLLGCSGISRTDMRVHPQKGVFILECNTAPGMTELSDIPAQAKAHGLSFAALIEELLLASCTD